MVKGRGATPLVGSKIIAHRVTLPIDSVSVYVPNSYPTTISAEKNAHLDHKTNSLICYQFTIPTKMFQ